ncbi:hypothetical protein AKJ16_DCAP13821 [Drosera capensis]
MEEEDHLLDCCDYSGDSHFGIVLDSRVLYRCSWTLPQSSDQKDDSLRRILFHCQSSPCTWRFSSVHLKDGFRGALGRSDGRCRENTASQRPPQLLKREIHPPESCIPLFNFTVIYDYLINSNLSHIISPTGAKVPGGSKQAAISSSK